MCEEMNNKDYIVRAMAAGGSIRAFCATTRELTEHARMCHNTSPVVTAALGRLLTAGAIMGSMQKGDDILTLQLRGTGPMKGITVTADANANVKGYPLVADVCIPANSIGKLDVSGAIGAGMLQVIKDLGLKEPYVGQVELISGEIAEDLAYYFTTSEQVPSAVALGVLMDKNNTVKQAGGLIIQALPGATDEQIDALTERLSHMQSMTTLLDAGYKPDVILDYILGDMDLEILDVIPTQFECNCDKNRVEKVVISLGRKEIEDIIKEGQPIELKCHFCNEAYTFSIDELKSLLKRV